MPETITASAEAPPESAGAPPVALDLTDPVVVAAINAAVEARIVGLKSTNVALKAEKTAAADQVAAYASFGTTAEVAAQKERLAELEAAESASTAGVSSDKFEAELSRRIDADRERFRKTNEDVETKRQETLAAAERRAEDLTVSENRWFLKAELAAAAPPGTFHDGALDKVVDDLLPRMVRESSPAGDVPRFQAADGVIIAGDGPDGKMTLKGLIGLRDTSAVLPGINLAWYKIDHGQGSATRRNDGGGNSAEKAWHKMSGKEQTEYVNRTPDASERQAHIDKSTIAQRQAAA